MALTISSAFDAGNIRVVKQDGDKADLETPSRGWPVDVGLQGIGYHGQRPEPLLS